MTMIDARTTEPMFNRLARRALIAVACLALSACSQDKFEDLNQYISEVQARPGTPIAPLPELKVYERYTYRGAGIRDPFKPAAKAEAPVAARSKSKSKLRPNVERNREALEQYALDTLKMVGSLNKDNEKWAIVKTSDGLIYRVKVGNHIGKNFGEITRITDKNVDITEVVSDGLGGWVERKATLKISN
jgi:type IV pilus assembly protein PilP